MKSPRRWGQFQDLLGLFWAACLVRALEAPPWPRLLLAMALLTAVIYVAMGWLKKRWIESERAKDRQERQQNPDQRRPADVAARRGFKSDGIVLLRDNAWDGAQVDGVTARWPQAMRGYHFVWPGRHRVQSGGPTPSTLDFVLYPGEIFVRRLHPQTLRWLPEHPENLDEVRKMASGGPWGAWKDSLVDFLQVMAVVPPERTVPPDKAELLASVTALCTRAAAQGTSAAPYDVLLEEARALGVSLIGVPLPIDLLKGVTEAVRHGVSAQRSRNDGLKVLDLGLALLPDDPFLLGARARSLLDVGLPEEALSAVEGALVRDMVLGPSGLAEARTTKADILIHLGRHREAGALLSSVLQTHPHDARAQRLHDAVLRHIDPGTP